MLSHESLTRSASIAAIFVAIILIITKSFIWITTKSISVQASLFDSLLDGLTSLINFIAIIHALKPPDACHRWGHGKAEALASFAQSLFIAGSAIWLLYNVTQNISQPAPIVDTGLGIYLMIFIIICTGMLIAWQQYVIKKTGSLVIQTDRLHYETDLLANLGVLVSLILSVKFKLIYLDLIVGLIIVTYILISTWDIFIESANILMDRELSDEIREDILHIARKNMDIKKIIELRTRSSGKKHFVQLALEFDKNITVSEYQDIIKSINQEIQQKIENTEVIIHPALL